MKNTLEEMKSRVKEWKITLGQSPRKRSRELERCFHKRRSKRNGQPREPDVKLSKSSRKERTKLGRGGGREKRNRINLRKFARRNDTIGRFSRENTADILPRTGQRKRGHRGAWGIRMTLYFSTEVRNEEDAFKHLEDNGLQPRVSQPASQMARGGPMFGPVGELS